MNTVDLPATITALGALVTAVGVIVLGWLSYRAKAAASRAAEKATSAESEAIASRELLDGKLIELDGKVFTLGRAVDGRLSKLLELAEANAKIRETSARAEGKLEGAADERASREVPP
jgi:hypothetical protein